MKKRNDIVPGLILGLAALTAQAQPVFQRGVLTDANGKTLYTFDKDAPGKSNCTGGCLAAWPMFVAREGAVPQGDFSVIGAAGARQWTFKGKPLYYYASDIQPGEMRGDGAGGAWHVVRQP